MRTLAVLALALGVSVPWTAGAQQPTKVARVGVLGYVEGQNLVIEHRHTTDKDRFRELAREAARKLGVTVHLIVRRGARELPDALGRATRDGARGLIVLSSPLINTLQNRPLIADAALSSRLPSINLFPVFTETRPGDLPIERPARFEFVINAKTAKALGLTLSPSLIQRADRIIE